MMEAGKLRLPDYLVNQSTELDLGPNSIMPVYDGGSIMNIPGSLCRFLGIQDFGEAPLFDQITSGLGDGVRRIVLILMDALAYHRLVNYIEEGGIPVWGDLARDGVFTPLTSIVPSTTSAALTTLWTGRSATAHGMLGYETYLKEYGIVANMILHAPITFRGEMGTMRSAGFDPKTFLPVPTVGSHLYKHHVDMHAFIHHTIIRSGLSEMHLEDVEGHGFSTPVELWANMHDLLETNRADRFFTWTYWGEVDSLSHYYGADNLRPKGEFQAFSQAFERYFLNTLSAEARKDTLVILTADHGMITTPHRETYLLKNHPDLDRMLHIITGENRFMYLYIRPGHMDDVREYFMKTWPGEFALIEPKEAVEAGLFGPGPYHSRLYERLGDLIAVARNDGFIWWHRFKNNMLGRHGGLRREEMLVPFLASRLG